MRRWHGDGRVCQLQPCRLHPRPGHDATRGGACPALAHLPASDVLSERRTDIIDTREVSKAGTGVLACYAGRVRHGVRTADMQGERTVDPRRRRGRGAGASPRLDPLARRSRVDSHNHKRGRRAAWTSDNKRNLWKQILSATHTDRSATGNPLKGAQIHVCCHDERPRLSIVYIERASPRSPLFACAPPFTRSTRARPSSWSARR